MIYVNVRRGVSLTKGRWEEPIMINIPIHTASQPPVHSSVATTTSFEYMYHTFLPAGDFLCLLSYRLIMMTFIWCVQVAMMDRDEATLQGTQSEAVTFKLRLSNLSLSHVSDTTCNMGRLESKMCLWEEQTVVLYKDWKTEEQSISGNGFYTLYFVVIDSGSLTKSLLKWEEDNLTF